jgi:hypothetical protein
VYQDEGERDDFAAAGGGGLEVARDGPLGDVAREVVHQVDRPQDARRRLLLQKRTNNYEKLK